jgi:hypothetical protein
VVPGEDRIGPVIETPATGPALVALPMRLGLIPTLLDALVRIAVGAAHAVRPAEMANDLVALGVVEDPQEVDPHDGRSLRRQIRSGGLLGLDCRVASSVLHSIPISLKRRMSLKS